MRVPRGALLNAYSQVDRDGTFHSPVQKPRDRFLKVPDLRMYLAAITPADGDPWHLWRGLAVVDAACAGFGGL